MANEQRRATWARSPKTYLFAAAVGVIGGMAGSLFQVISIALTRLIIGPDHSLLVAARGLEWYQKLLIPFFGAIVASLLAYGLTRKRASQGMSDVMEAVTLKKAQGLSATATIARALSSLALIATGGSLGREGPNSYLGASFGTRFARMMKVPGPQLGLYAGCGIAAGISASYFAPFGAALFALEIVLGNFAVEIFAPVVISSIVASLLVEALSTGIFAGYIHGAPLYDLPKHFTQSHPAEGLLYLLLGCLAGCSAWLFINSMRRTESLFRRLPIPMQLRLPLGGLLIGVIGIWLPEVWGNGYEACDAVLQGTQAWLPFIIFLFFMKIIATSISIGSGGSGGIFTPLLFTGVALGMIVGTGAEAIWVDIDARTYAVVGMAAAVAAATQAPIMAIFLLFEMTGETKLVLPLMIAAMSASLTARALGLRSIYVDSLARKGLLIPEGIEETALTTTRVEDLMRADAVWVRENATFDMIIGMFKKTRRDAIYVVGGKELTDTRLIGMIRLHDVKNFLTNQELGPAIIATDLTVAVPSVLPGQTLAEVLRHFDDPERHELPVTDPDTHALIATLDRRDLLTHMSVEVLQTQQLRAKFVPHEGAQHYVEMPEGHALGRIPVPEKLAGLTLAESDFRRRTGLTIQTIIRADNGKEVREQPEAEAVLRKGDALIVMGPRDRIREYGGEV